MSEPKPAPHVRIPVAVFEAFPDAYTLGCVCDLYRFADRQRYEPFEAADSWLELRWGLSKRQVRGIVATLVRRGFLVVVDAGSRVTPRLVRVARCGNEVNHLADHSADHLADHGNDEWRLETEHERTSLRTTQRTTERTEEDRLQTTDLRPQTSDPEVETLSPPTLRPAFAGQHDHQQEHEHGPIRAPALRPDPGEPTPAPPATAGGGEGDEPDPRDQGLPQPLEQAVAPAAAPRGEDRQAAGRHAPRGPRMAGGHEGRSHPHQQQEQPCPAPPMTTTSTTPPLPSSSGIGTTTASASERRRTAATAAGGTPAGASREPPQAVAAPVADRNGADLGSGVARAMARPGTSEPGAPLPDPAGPQGGEGSQGGGGNVAGGVLAAPTGQGVAGDVVRAATRPDAGAPAEPAALTTKAAAKWGSLSAVWSVLMADRAELHPGSRGLALTTEGKQPRAPALRGVLRALDQAGYGLDELRAALRWLYTSSHFRARSARETQDPVMALLRHAVDYVDLALDGAQAPAQAAPHASTAPVAPPTRQEAPSAPPVVAEVAPESPAEPYVPFRPVPPKDWKPPPPPFALLTGGRRHG